MVLIETLWNVKQRKLTESEAVKAVLIETLWNVKIGMTCQVGDGVTVLIETLWNVKRNDKKRHGIISRY